MYELGDGLDLHKEWVNVLLKPGHYDLLCGYEVGYDHDYAELEKKVQFGVTRIGGVDCQRGGTQLRPPRHADSRPDEEGIHAFGRGGEEWADADADADADSRAK